MLTLIWISGWGKLVPDAVNRGQAKGTLMKREIGPVDPTKDRTSIGGLWELPFSTLIFRSCCVSMFRETFFNRLEWLTACLVERGGHAPGRAQQRHYHVSGMMFFTCFGEGRDARGILNLDSYGSRGRRQVDRQ
jgi:hypothetical protein